MSDISGKGKEKNKEKKFISEINTDDHIMTHQILRCSCLDTDILSNFQSPSKHLDAYHLSGATCTVFPNGITIDILTIDLLTDNSP